MGFVITWSTRRLGVDWARMTMPRHSVVGGMYQMRFQGFKSSLLVKDEYRPAFSMKRHRGVSISTTLNTMTEIKSGTRAASIRVRELGQRALPFAMASSNPDEHRSAASHRPHLAHRARKCTRIQDVGQDVARSAGRL